MPHAESPIEAYPRSPEETILERWNDPRWAGNMALRIDFSNMMSEFVGEAKGITRGEIDGLVPRARVAAENITAMRASGILGFYGLPYDGTTTEEIVKTSQALGSDCDDFVVLGIGGSALGGAALFQALCHPLHNQLPRPLRSGAPRVFFLDNVDPVTFEAVLNFVDPKTTVFNIVTKSGTTTETAAQFMVVHRMLAERLGAEGIKGRIVVTTGPEHKAMRAFSERAGYPMLTVPETVGGRFSVLSPVGLFPAAMAGIDIAELVAGARLMDGRCARTEIWSNPAYLGAALHYLADTRKGLNIAVIMPYCDALSKIGYWFRQLWAESLGKGTNTSGNTVNSGQTPIAAFGATDQHSQLQLYQEGPFNKMITFLIVERHASDVPIPVLDGIPEFSHLAGHTFSELINVEADSTRFALTKAGRSNMSIFLPEVNAFTVGQLLFMLQVQTIFAGGLYGVNPLDQPGVEASKDYIYGLMGRSGFETKAAEILNRSRIPTHYVI